MQEVANAHGSTSNPDVMSNLERALNVRYHVTSATSDKLTMVCCKILKGRLYTTEGLPTGDDQWAFWMNNPGQGTAEAALSALRAVFGVFNYMNAIADER